MVQITPRIGVFICRCGRNIAEIIDLKEVIEEIEKIKDVICVETNTFMCSLPGQNLLEKKIKELNLNRVVIAACSLNVHKTIFENVICHCHGTRARIASRNQKRGQNTNQLN